LIEQPSMKVPCLANPIRCRCWSHLSGIVAQNSRVGYAHPSAVEDGWTDDREHLRESFNVHACRGRARDV
jgi:hypothetical protein